MGIIKAIGTSLGWSDKKIRWTEGILDVTLWIFIILAAYFGIQQVNSIKSCADVLTCYCGGEQVNLTNKSVRIGNETVKIFNKTGYDWSLTFIDLDRPLALIERGDPRSLLGVPLLPQP
jgi:hypothetical protein